MSRHLVQQLVRVFVQRAWSLSLLLPTVFFPFDIS
jgi:hypothetical protein